ncbi:MAG: ATP-dependent sacrificial sulfur transferase LarE [Armatimonadota bacterium]
MVEDRLQEKKLRLRRILSNLHSAVVAFSGGCDSALLLAVASEVMDDCIAVTARAPIFPPEELQRAKTMAAQLGVEHLVIDFHPFEMDDFAANTPQRCYYCKRRLLELMREIADERGLQHVIEASQLDDAGDFRPGLRAVDELGVRSPLMEAGFGKKDVRALSKAMGLMTADLPSAACFASRIPYGTRIDSGMIAQVAEAEAVLRELGFEQVRVRHHGEIARIEVPPTDLCRLVSDPGRSDILRRLREIGFTYITADVAGYRTGSMNEALEEEETSGETN